MTTCPLLLHFLNQFVDWLIDIKQKMIYMNFYLVIVSFMFITLQVDCHYEESIHLLTFSEHRDKI